MENLIFDIYIGAVALTGLLVGLLLAKKLATTCWRNRKRAFKVRFTWTIALCLGFVSSCLYWRHISPYYYIAAIEEDQKADDPDAQWAEDDLVEMGSQAVGPIIESVSGIKVFYRGTCLLPDVLKRIGAPAHQALLTSIDQKSSYERVGLIYTLQDAFHDNSRLPLWIDYAISQDRPEPLLEGYVTHCYPDAPVMSNGHDGINPDFVTWYQRRNPR